MLIITSAGITLIAMAYLENKGKISINYNIIYFIGIGIFLWGGWGVIKKIANTLFLNI